MLNTKPSLQQVGHTIVKLTNQQFDNHKTKWASKKKGKLSKTANLLKAISDNPLAQTNTLRVLADCSNVSDRVRSINKKIMNSGLMIIRVSPTTVSPSEDFHYWCLIEAPIVDIPVKMAVNDPLNK